MNASKQIKYKLQFDIINTNKKIKNKKESHIILVIPQLNGNLHFDFDFEIL